MEFAHFNKYAIKRQEEKASQRSRFDFFSSRYSENYVLKGKFNPKMDIIEVFFSKLSVLFSDFQKGVGMVSPPSSPTSFAPV